MVLCIDLLLLIRLLFLSIFIFETSNLIFFAKNGICVRICSKLSVKCEASHINFVILWIKVVVLGQSLWISVKHLIL